MPIDPKSAAWKAGLNLDLLSPPPVPGEMPAGNNPIPAIGTMEDVEAALDALIESAKRAKMVGPKQSKKMFFHLLGVLNQLGVVGRAYDAADVGYVMRVYKAFAHLSGAKPSTNF